MVRSYPCSQAFYKAGTSHTYWPVATCTRKPGSIETVCGTFQTKSAKNWDDKLTQYAHLHNPHLALHTVVGYPFLYLALTSRKTVKDIYA